MLPKSNSLNTGFTGFLKAKSFVKKFISSSLMVLFISYMVVLLALIGCSGVDSTTESEQAYTVTFDTGGGSSIAEVKVSSGDTLTKPSPDPVSNNYSFAGWYSDADLTQEYDFSKVVISSFTLYAKWEKIIYTITFDTGAGSSIAEVKVSSGDTLTKPSPDPVSNNYSFVGWYSDADLTQEYDFSKVVISSFTLYAKWKEIHTIIFNTGEGSSISSMKVTNGDTLTKPTDPTSNNYSFVGWYSDAELTQSYNFSEAVTNSFTLYSKWEKITYTVTFDTMGGSSIVAVSVDSGDTLTKPSSDPTRSDYSFAGWHSDSGLTQEYDFNEAVTGDFTLYAKWKELHTVTFDTGGGSSIAEVKVGSGDTLTKPSSDPASNNYSFVGWYSDAGLTQEYDFIEVVTNSFTLYAKWASVVYTVTFDTGGGSSIAEVSVDSGDTLTKPSSDPTRSDYSFAGWHSDSGLTQEYDFNKAVTGSFTLYAKWDKIHTVTFSTGEGSSVNPVKVTNGDTLTKPISPTPVSSDFAFAEWHSNDLLTGRFDFSQQILSDITLYAAWGSTSMIGLSNIMSKRSIPSDRTTYTSQVQEALSQFSGTPTVNFRYVKKGGTGNGLSWEQAAGDTKTVIGNISGSSGNVYFVLVASGTYPANQIRMKNHIAIIGGWDIAGGWTRFQKTIFDGENKNQVFYNQARTDNTALLYEVAIINGKADEGAGMYNSYASPSLMNVTFSGNQASSRYSGGGGLFNDNGNPFLSNVTFSGNTAYKGAGMYNKGSSPVLVKLTFSGNTATDVGGGGMYNYKNSSPSLKNVIFSGNRATSTSSSKGRGAGVYNDDSSSPSLVNVTFTNNVSGGHGGGIYNYKNSSPYLKNVTFVNNRGHSGGGVYNSSSSPILVNTTFSGNQATHYAGNGGGIYNHTSSSVKLINVTLYNNTAGANGGGVYSDTGSDAHGPFLVNTVLWGNQANNVANQIYIDNISGTTPGEKLDLHYSLIEGGDDLGKGVILNVSSSPGTVSYTHSQNLAGDPLLGSLSDNGGDVLTRALGQNSPAIDAGVYVKKSGSTLYFSVNQTSWYTSFDNNGLSGTETLTANLPANTEDVNTTDARGHTRTTVPDIGAYEAN